MNISIADHKGETQFEFQKVKCLLEEKEDSEENYNKIWTLQCMKYNVWLEITKMQLIIDM